MIVPIYVHYDTTNQPWGGINSFFRAFKEHINGREDCRLVREIDDDYKILLMGANAYGRVERIKYSDIEEVKRRGIKIVHRLDGLRSKYTKNKRFSEGDLKQVELASLADHIVFQSRSCYDVFKGVGLSSDKYSIVSNGVNQEVFKPRVQCKDRKELWVLSASWSNNINKGFETIAKMSEIPGIHSFFVGNWCKEVDSKSVTILEPMTSDALAQCYKTCDVFLHAAEGDPCPNVVLEALSSGLPIIYHNSGGTPEIVRGCGTPLSEDKTLKEVLDIMRDSYSKLLTKVQENMMYFSIGFSADQYIKIFKQVLKR